MLGSKAPSSKGNRSFSVTTAPTTEPITVSELKEFARIDTSAEDTILGYYITSARQACEHYLGRALITQTIRMRMDYWPGEVIELLLPPLQSVSAVVTIDEDDSTTTFSSSNYFIDTNDMFGKLIIKNGAEYPVNSDRFYGGYQITYIAGYGDDATDVPRAIRDALLMWATDIYESRAIRTEPPPQAMPLLHQYKVVKI